MQNCVQDLSNDNNYCFLKGPKRRCASSGCLLIQGWTATIKHRVTRKRRRKRWKAYKKAVTQLSNTPVKNVMLAYMKIVLKHIAVINSKALKNSNTHTTRKNRQFNPRKTHISRYQDNFGQCLYLVYFSHKISHIWKDKQNLRYKGHIGSKKIYICIFVFLEICCWESDITFSCR